MNEFSYISISDIQLRAESSVDDDSSQDINNLPTKKKIDLIKKEGKIKRQALVDYGDALIKKAKNLRDKSKLLLEKSKNVPKARRYSMEKEAAGYRETAQQLRQQADEYFAKASDIKAKQKAILDEIDTVEPGKLKGFWRELKQDFKDNVTLGDQPLKDWLPSKNEEKVDINERMNQHDEDKELEAPDDNAEDAFDDTLEENKKKSEEVKESQNLEAPPAPETEPVQPEAPKPSEENTTEPKEDKPTEGTKPTEEKKDDAKDKPTEEELTIKAALKDLPENILEMFRDLTNNHLPCVPITSAPKVTNKKKTKKADNKTDKKTDKKKPRQMKTKEKVLAPAPSVFPLMITDDAKKLWPEFYKKYSKIFKKKDLTPAEQWSIAVAIFKNYCLKPERNVCPFTDEASYLNQATQAYLKDRLNSNRDKLVKKINPILTSLSKKDLVRKILKEKIESVAYNKKSKLYEIKSIVTCVFAKGITFKDKKFIDALKQKNFLAQPNKFVCTVGIHTITAIPFADKEVKDRFKLVVSINFAPQQVKYILGLQNKDLENSETVASKLAKKAKALIQDYKVNTELTATVTAALFSKEGLAKDDSSLNLVMDIVKEMDVNVVKGTYTLDYIRALGDLAYRLDLLKSLARHVKSKDTDIPVAWQLALDNPQQYLDPDISLATEEYINQSSDSDF